MNTEMDHLVIGHFILERLAQPGRSVRRAVEPGGD
jgi:hypothetical protein